MVDHRADRIGPFDLVVTQTDDQVRLHGLFQAAEQPPAEKGSDPRFDGAVMLHGLGGNFYNSKLNFSLAAGLRQLGIDVVLGNTRGHDGISMNIVSGRAQTIGAAYEIVDQCRYDVRGWVDWLAQRDKNRIVLVGHSLGAIKSLYAQAHEPHPNVRAIVGFSATRLSHHRLMQSPRREDFQHWIEQASQLVEAGEGQALLQVDFPFPTHICAASYLDKYGSADRYNWINFASQIHVPVVLVFGENELRDNAAFHGLLDEVRPLVESLPNFELKIVPSADHFYSGVYRRARQTMCDWISATKSV